MATFEIPTRNDIYNYTFQTDLETVTYTFKIRYNRRLDRQVMDIQDTVNNIPLIGGDDLLKQFHHLDGIPPGELKIVDLDQLNRDPNELTFSDRIILAYRETV